MKEARVDNVVIGVENWTKEVEEHGDKGWFLDRIGNDPKSYMIAWCTKFQLE
ncbi:hypothetical protein BGZ65_012562, partial [Modicella reniformis]